jgi:TatA/E family protein of Tat protein translocase
MNALITPAFITSGPDMLIILVIALIVFGPKKLPEIGKQIGMALRELNKVRGDVQRAFDLDELTHYDTTSQYHPAPYGATYPATDSLPAVETAAIAPSDATPVGDHAVPLAPLTEAPEHYAYHDDAPVQPAPTPILAHPPGPPSARAATPVGDVTDAQKE